MKQFFQRAFVTCVILALFCIAYLWRSNLGLKYDPRNPERVSEIRKQEESLAFTQRLQSTRFNQFFWPGLKAAHLSFIWLQTLSGLHNEASYTQDYSWLFSKLYTFAKYSNPGELNRVLKVAPFLYVIGKDPVGSTLLSLETIHRYPQNWRSWYWAAFHNLENLHNKPLAGDLYLESSKRPGAPFYVAALGLRLKAGLQANVDLSEKLELMLGDLPADVVKQIKKSRPEYFQ